MTVYLETIKKENNKNEKLTENKFLVSALQFFCFQGP